MDIRGFNQRLSLGRDRQLLVFARRAPYASAKSASDDSVPCDAFPSGLDIRKARY